jgi:hypothetical protein
MEKAVRQDLQDVQDPFCLSGRKAKRYHPFSKEVINKQKEKNVNPVNK